MISESYKVYCSEDPSLIENYDKAIIDEKTIWVIHHRLETELNATSRYLKHENLYFNRPASELIYLTPSAHAQMHKKHSDKKDYKKIIPRKKITEITDEMLEQMMF